MKKLNVTVILLSYDRPFNIQSIVESVLSCKEIDNIIVSNNNPAINIDQWITLKDDRVKIINQLVKKGCGYRWHIAKTVKSSYYIAIDDDIFLTPDQIKDLLCFLKTSPKVLHGVFGTSYNSTNCIKKTKYYKQINLNVDVLHQVYATTYTHIDNYFYMLKQIEDESPSIKKIIDSIADDILISKAGMGMPMIHNLGFINECKTSKIEGIAVHKEPGFHEKRLKVFEAIIKINKRVVDDNCKCNNSCI